MEGKSAGGATDAATEHTPITSHLYLTNYTGYLTGSIGIVDLATPLTFSFRAVVIA